MFTMTSHITLWWKPVKAIPHRPIAIRGKRDRVTHRYSLGWDTILHTIRHANI